MTIIQLNWEVANLETLLGNGFDQQKIEVDNPAPGTELTRSNTRLPLVANVERYLWEVPGDVAYNYQAVPYRSLDGATDAPIPITNKKVRGYCTIAEMRAEGFQDPPHSDARVQASIDRAVGLIDRICGQRFDPYYAVVRLNVEKAYDEHHLDIPIAALWKIAEEDQDLTLSDILVFNRHLTSGLTNPDDRRHPQIAWGHDREGAVILGSRSLAYQVGAGRFLRGRKTLRLWGVWGFTELGPADMVGETAEGSQIPLSYGTTPAEINYACMLLAADYLGRLADGDTDASVAARVISEKTRDQSYTLQARPDEEATYGMTGNTEVDNILMRYVAPLRVGAV